MGLIKNIIEKIENFFIPKKYSIGVDSGVFQVQVFGPPDGIAGGREVIVERSTDLPPGFCSPGIKIIDTNKNPLDINILQLDSQWRFTMPEKNIIIVPTVKRKKPAGNTK